MRAVMRALARARQTRAGRAYGSLHRLLRVPISSCAPSSVDRAPGSCVPARTRVRKEGGGVPQLESEGEDPVDEPPHRDAPLILRQREEPPRIIPTREQVRGAAASQLEPVAAPINDGATRRLPQSAGRHSLPIKRAPTPDSEGGW